MLAASNYIIFHFSQKTSRKMVIHQKISLRDLLLLPELHLHASDPRTPVLKMARTLLEHPSAITGRIMIVGWEYRTI